jgi:hypothetical protein
MKKKKKKEKRKEEEERNVFIYDLNDKSFNVLLLFNILKEEKL